LRLQNFQKEVMRELNCDPLTSEYMTSYKYTLYIYKEQTVTSLPIIHTYNFRTKSDAMDKEKSIIDNPSYYEAK